MGSGPAAGTDMKTSRGLFGNICLLISIMVIYGLLGYKAYVFFSEGIWLDWSAGNYLSDSMAMSLIEMRPSPIKSVVLWILSQDIVLLLLPFPFLLVLIDRGIGRESGD